MDCPHVYPQALAMYPSEHGCVWTCQWLCIHVHMAMYPYANDCGDTCKIWFCAIDQGAEFAFALRAGVQNQWLQRRWTWTCRILSRNSAAKNSTYINCNTKPIPSMPETPLSIEKIDSVLWTPENEIQIVIHRWLQSQIQNSFRVWNRGSGGWGKKPEVKNLIRLSLSLCCVPDRLGLIFVSITAYRGKTQWLMHALKGSVSPE
jgi:hypothetical protein